jgi:hypothetical protein
MRDEKRKTKDDRTKTSHVSRFSFLVFKYCANGEVAYIRSTSLEAAKDRLRVIYLKKFGVFNLTDIKPLPIPQRERTNGRTANVS